MLYWSGMKIAKPATNHQIANIFEEIALFLRAQEVPFKPQAYEVAAEHVRALEEELSESYKTCGNECIDAIPGIGKNLAQKIEELVTTGQCKAYNALKKKYPFDMLGLTSIQDVGPKTALNLYKRLRIRTIDDLEQAAKGGKIALLPNMGVRSQRNILRGIQFRHGTNGRQIIHQAIPYASHIIEQLIHVPGVEHIDIAGSLRRRKETIGDIDLLAISKKPIELIHAFTRLPFVAEILEQGSTKVSVRYKNNMNGDLRILKPEEYGAGLIYFTGSKEHNILLRERAIKQKMKLSEYGLFKGKKRVADLTEKQIYTALGLQEIPPEIRVGEDEMEWAARNKIPSLIAYGSLKGDCQVQTNWSDGSASIEQMARTAKAYGLSYIAITDHTQSLTIANGLDEKRLLVQGKEIERLNKKLKGFRLLKSTECDIRQDGSLDLHDEVLRTLDLVCVSIHSHRTLSKEKMTERVIRALKHPLVHILFHPTGRIVNVRDGYEIDMDQVIKAAKLYRVALEVNGSERLDMHEKLIRQAVETGVKLGINSDAHTPEQFSNLDIGIGQARRGWVKKTDVLNTKSVDQFLRAIKK